MGVIELCKVLLPVLFSTFALITSLLYSFWCESVQFNPLNDKLPVIRFGPWYREIYTIEVEAIGGETNLYVRQGCAAYPENTDMDSKWKATRAFTVITALFGSLLCLMLWFSLCMNFASDAVWNKLGIFVVFFMVLFQGLTFLLLRTNLCDGDILKLPLLYDSQCKWSFGSTSNVVSIVLWLWTGAAMMILGPSKTNSNSDDSNMRDVENAAESETKQAEETSEVQEKALGVEEVTQSADESGTPANE